MSEFWKRKVRTYFKVHDFDNDGYISEDDFVEIGRSFAASRKATAEKTEELTRNMHSLWRKYMKSADLKISKRLTADILIESMRQQLYDPDFVCLVNQLIHGMFDLLDVNQDGYLQPEEYGGWFEDMGFPEKAFNRKFAFDAMDTNHDNKLSIEEFARGYFDFIFSQDESSPNKFFLGPLVE